MKRNEKREFTRQVNKMTAQQIHDMTIQACRNYSVEVMRAVCDVLREKHKFGTKRLHDIVDAVEQKLMQ